MVTLKINTITYDFLNKIYRISIPPKIIPETFKAEMIKNAELLEENKKKLRSRGKSLKEIRAENEAFREKNKFKSVFAFFIQLENNLNILSFKSADDKSDFYQEQQILKITDAIMNTNAKYFDKEIRLMPLTEKESPKSFGSLEEVSETIDILKGQIEHFKTIVTKFMRLMILDKVNEEKYAKNKHYLKHIAWNDEENDTLDLLYDEDKVIIKEIKGGK